MRSFVYFSRNAWTTGNFKDLMNAGRIDIACHIIIHSFFVSNAKRDSISLHLFFYGPPDPPKHLKISTSEENGKVISKKDVAGLIKRMLFKYKKGKNVEAFPGCFVEKKSLIKHIEELSEEERQVFILDKKGTDIRDVEIPENPVFILGDQEGFPKKELKRIKQTAKPVSLGKITYFASQSMAILQNELDRRGIF